MKRPFGDLKNAAESQTRVEVSTGKLADLYATPEVQRIGYLLEKLGRPDLSKPLAGWLVKRRHRPIALVRGIGAENIAADPKWRVLANEALEADL